MRSGGDKLKLGLFSLSCCEGCSVEFLNLEEKIAEIMNHYEIVNFRFVMDVKDLPVDIAFVEGTPTNFDEVKKIKNIRKNCHFLINLGSCATNTGVMGIINSLSKNDCLGTSIQNYFNSFKIKPISLYVTVDYELPGCPFSKNELINLLTCLIMDKKFRLPEYSVCVECSLEEQSCLLNMGLPCMGPVTRGGCGAICPENNAVCLGCRGTYSDSNIKGHIKILRAYGLSDTEIVDIYSLFCNDILNKVIAWLREK